MHAQCTAISWFAFNHECRASDGILQRTAIHAGDIHACMHNVHIHVYVRMSKSINFTNVGSGAAEQLLGNRAVGQALDGVCVSVLQNALH